MAYINTKTFIEVFPTGDSFATNFTDSSFADYIYPTDDAENTLNLIYNLLLSKYANSHIADDNEDSFKQKINVVIFQYEPAWMKKLEVQKNLRNLTEADLRAGSVAKFTHGYNPSTVPGTANSDTEIETVNDQTLNKYTKSKLDGYGELLSLLDEDVTTAFLGKFKKLFMSTIDVEDILLKLMEE